LQIADLLQIGMVRRHCRSAYWLQDRSPNPRIEIARMIAAAAGS